ncbi:CRISPR-associated helicase Cas3' [Streptomyces andamanensis]|uniref:CRISPR-associated helicase Cas3 n=1 Tax=Streptomyces andamanensis TaxID=1565035 RepID=A0ABV8TG71_9ACTN
MHDPERLTAHSRTVMETVHDIRVRIGDVGVIACEPAFWTRVSAAALLHDTGKIAEGFQRQILPGGPPWGERHEVLSLAYVDLLARAASWSADDRLMIAALVATHHRPLHGTDNRRPGLASNYGRHTDWEKAFTRIRTPDGATVPQVTSGVHHELVAWLAGMLGVDPPPDPSDGRTLADRAGSLLKELLDHWNGAPSLDVTGADHGPVRTETGLLAALGQGALTLADHAGSAHVALQTHLPLPADYDTHPPRPPYPHQRYAAQADGHLVLTSPTGSGKTEAALGWAAHQIRLMPGLPRLVWTLPYRASLNAARDRFRRDLTAAPGEQLPDIGLLHGTAAHTLLREATDDECPTGTSDVGSPGTQQSGRADPTRTMAKQARARVNAMRLFTQRMRVATPHQLLAGALAGPSHSSVLLEQSNSLFVLDELHAYDPQTFGRLLAAMRLWETLGSRIAVLSATLAPPLLRLVQESLTAPVTLVRAAPGTAPDRHRLALDPEPLSTPASLDRIRRWLHEGHSVLVVVNTVDRARTLFEELADDARDTCPDDPDAALLLHSRFRHQDRDTLEHRLLARHPERTADDSVRRGGLVVATQAVEVSLQLDFDRGAVENAPIEAVAQRAGRVNRRGRHPDGPVEFRVHRTESHLPYDQGAVDAAWHALTTLVTEGATTFGEQDIDRLLQLAYATEWGAAWSDEARRCRDSFAQSFLTFEDPFHDRSDYEEALSEQFDGVEVLWRPDEDTYRRLIKGPQGDPLLAARLLVPLRYRQLKPFEAAFDRDLGLYITDGEYDCVLGLRRPTAPETVL